MDGFLPRGVTRAADPTVAARELHQAIWRPGLALAVVFVSPRPNVEELIAALALRFGDTPVIGCTTAGEITPNGYEEDSAVGVGFPSSDFCVVMERVDHIDRFEVSDSVDVMRALMEKRDRALAARGDGMAGRRGFTMLLMDGLAMSEETVVSALNNLLVDYPLIGASAGDALRFEKTYILYDGRAYLNSAVVALVTTSRRFSVFRTEHFVSSGRKMVVTGADPAQRLVTEINAEPAGPEYARMVGLEGKPLTPMIFAVHPVVVRVGGQYHVRSIQKVNEDESLSFFCAIDEGIVLTVAEGVDILSNFDSLMERLEEELNGVDLILGFDCTFRRLELQGRGLLPAMSERMAQHRIIGFNAYGEQYGGMHLNQTFTGVAIGGRWSEP